MSNGLWQPHGQFADDDGTLDSPRSRMDSRRKEAARSLLEGGKNLREQIRSLWNAISGEFLGSMTREEVIDAILELDSDFTDDDVNDCFTLPKYNFDHFYTHFNKLRNRVNKFRREILTPTSDTRERPRSAIGLDDPDVATKRRAGFMNRSQSSRRVSGTNDASKQKAFSAYEAMANEEDMAEQMFRILDHDGDGHLERTELKAAMLEINPDAFSEQALDVIWEALDVDGDGFITIEEFRENFGLFLFGGATKKEKDIEKKQREMESQSKSLHIPAFVRQAFDQADFDHSGSIDEAELPKALGLLLGRSAQPSEVAQARLYLRAHDEETVDTIDLETFAKVADLFKNLVDITDEDMAMGDNFENLASAPENLAKLSEAYYSIQRKLMEQQALTLKETVRYNKAMDGIHSLEKENEELRAKIGTLESKIADQLDELDRNNSNDEDTRLYREQRDRLQLDLDSLRKEYDQVSAQNEHSRKQKMELSQQTAELQRKYDELSHSKDEESNKFAQERKKRQAELLNLIEKNRDLQGQVKELGHIEAENDELHRLVAELQAQQADSQAMMDQFKQTINELRLNMAQLDPSMALSFSAQLDELDRESVNLSANNLEGEETSSRYSLNLQEELDREEVIKMSEDEDRRAEEERLAREKADREKKEKEEQERFEREEALRARLYREKLEREEEERKQREEAERRRKERDEIERINRLRDEEEKARALEALRKAQAEAEELARELAQRKRAVKLVVVMRRSAQLPPPQNEQDQRLIEQNVAQDLASALKIPASMLSAKVVPVFENEEPMPTPVIESDSASAPVVLPPSEFYRATIIVSPDSLDSEQSPAEIAQQINDLMNSENEAVAELTHNFQTQATKVEALNDAEDKQFKVKKDGMNHRLRRAKNLRIKLKLRPRVLHGKTEDEIAKEKANLIQQLVDDVANCVDLPPALISAKIDDPQPFDKPDTIPVSLIVYSDPEMYPNAKSPYETWKAVEHNVTDSHSSWFYGVESRNTDPFTLIAEPLSKSEEALLAEQHNKERTDRKKKRVRLHFRLRPRKNPVTRRQQLALELQLARDVSAAVAIAGVRLAGKVEVSELPVHAEEPEAEVVAVSVLVNPDIEGDPNAHSPADVGKLLTFQAHDPQSKVYTGVESRLLEGRSLFYEPLRPHEESRFPPFHPTNTKKPYVMKFKLKERPQGFPASEPSKEALKALLARDMAAALKIDPHGLHVALGRGDALDPSQVPVTVTVPYDANHPDLTPLGVVAAAKELVHEHKSEWFDGAETRFTDESSFVTSPVEETAERRKRGRFRFALRPRVYPETDAEKTELAQQIETDLAMAAGIDPRRLTAMIQSRETSQLIADPGVPVSVTVIPDSDPHQKSPMTVGGESSVMVRDGDALWFSGVETRHTDPTSFRMEVLDDDPEDVQEELKNRRAKILARLKDRLYPDSAKEGEAMRNQIRKDIENALLIPFERTKVVLDPKDPKHPRRVPFTVDILPDPIDPANRPPHQLCTDMADMMQDTESPLYSGVETRYLDPTDVHPTTYDAVAPRRNLWGMVKSKTNDALVETKKKEHEQKKKYMAQKKKFANEMTKLRNELSQMVEKKKKERDDQRIQDSELEEMKKDAPAPTEISKKDIEAERKRREENQQFLKRISDLSEALTAEELEKQQVIQKAEQLKRALETELTKLAEKVVAAQGATKELARKYQEKIEESKQLSQKLQLEEKEAADLSRKIAEEEEEARQLHQKLAEEEKEAHDLESKLEAAEAERKRLERERTQAAMLALDLAEQLDETRRRHRASKSDCLLM